MLKKKKNSKKPHHKNISPIDGISIEDMTKEQLENYVQLISKELERERKERNYFILERDKINTFWEIAKKQLEVRSSELRIRDHELDESEERHQTELKIYKQKLKQLISEQKMSKFDQKCDLVHAVNKAELEFTEQKYLLLDTNKQLESSHRKGETENQQLIQNMKLLHEEQLYQLQKDFEQQLDDERRRSEEKLNIMFDSMELQRKTELHETEERKNSQLDMHMKNHEKAFADIKSYYNDITLNNLTLINSLKDELADTKKRHDLMEKKNSEISRGFKSLEDNFLKLKKENEALINSTTNYKCYAESLKLCKTNLKKTKKNFKNLNLDYEILTQRLKFVESERDELYEKFVSAVQEVQQKCGLKNVMLEHRMNTLTEQLELNEIQFTSIASTQNIDQNAVAGNVAKIEERLAAKNEMIKDLQLEMAKVYKTYQELISVLRNKLDIYGISFDEVDLPILKPSCLGKLHGMKT